MPSLFTHLIVAQDALESLLPGPARDLLETESALYYLGCLCPDLPYFDIFHSYRGLPLGSVLGPMTHTLESRILAWLGWSMPEQEGWALRLHAPGADGIVEGWARRASAEGEGRALAALAAGMATHCAADAVLHPKVEMDSGGVSTAESMRRHRELEINLDYVLMRCRGVAVESLTLVGFLEAFLGRVDQTGEYLSPSLKRAWLDASAACDGEGRLRRGDLDAWSRGFAGAMRLLEHPLSPMQREKRRFLAGGEERWRTHFARELYLASHVPRAVRAAQGVLTGMSGGLGGRIVSGVPGPGRT